MVVLFTSVFTCVGHKPGARGAPYMRPANLNWQGCHLFLLVVSVGVVSFVVVGWSAAVTSCLAALGSPSS